MKSKRSAGGATPLRAPDRVLTQIADYVLNFQPRRRQAWDAAHDCLIDSLGCGFEALAYPECMKLVGPVVPGSVVPNGARVPGTSLQLDPVSATFSTGALIRWVDYSDAFFGATVMHPSDCFCALLSVADWLSRSRLKSGKRPLAMREVLHAAIQAYEIVGWLGLDNNFNATRLDNVLLVKVAVSAVATRMLGGNRDEIVSAVSNAWVDGHALATFRRAPNTGSRKSWSAADAASRGVWLALVSVKGEMGYPSALTAKTWGFYDVIFKGRPFRFSRALGSHVVENALFKISYPAALHAQTAVEAAIKLHPLVRDRLDDIRKVELWTHATCILMIDKQGPLRNFADRDHCLQYMAAIGLIFGALTGRDYEDAVAADPRIDALRAKMVVREERRYTRDYRNPAKRSNANAVRVHFGDGTSTARVEVEYPLGHRARRREGAPLLVKKFEESVNRAFAPKQQRAVLEACMDRERLKAMPVNEFMDLLAA
ncbi:MAG TPA: bifunctional 2-methylcitrate dehydratase/aconitate hydratase [Burkholderiales bacterium]|nr:bifunctional 2-methylcitrate dehydratase/aconitate hydratase [Burkholderiales bacterium]